MSELQMQRLIIEDVKKCGGFAFKMSNRFMVGVPDLYIATPRHWPVLVECKFVKELPKRKTTSVLLNLTPKQRHFIRQTQYGGGYSGWVIGLKMKIGNKNHWKFAVGVDSKVKSIRQIDLNDRFLYRDPNTPSAHRWVENFLDYLGN